MSANTKKAALADALQLVAMAVVQWIRDAKTVYQVYTIADPKEGGITLRGKYYGQHAAVVAAQKIAESEGVTVFVDRFIENGQRVWTFAKEDAK